MYAGKGRRYTKTYQNWTAMKSRCRNTKDPHYPQWGGRGITYDPAWEDYDNFLMDMGEQPDGRSLGRIDNDGPYTKANCRWETALMQAQNTRTCHQYEFQGVTGTLRQHAMRHGWDYKLVKNRVRKGWTLEKAATTPRSK